MHISSHLMTGNSKMLEEIGVTADTPNPDGGRIQRKAGSNEPSGVLEELAMILVLKKLPMLEIASGRVSSSSWSCRGAWRWESLYRLAALGATARTGKSLAPNVAPRNLLRMSTDGVALKKTKSEDNGLNLDNKKAVRGRLWKSRWWRRRESNPPSLMANHLIPNDVLPLWLALVTVL
jgi:hypothetical protein